MEAAELKIQLAEHALWLETNGAVGVQANFSNENLKGVDLQSANLRRAILLGANLAEANLYQADLGYAKLEKANLVYADLVHANLSYADLTYANLSGSNLRSANLAHAILRRANLASAILDCADLSHVEGSFANLSHAVLSNASLKDADFTDGNFSAASLCSADLTDADFSACNMTGVRYNSNMKISDQTILTGESWATYLKEVVPWLLTAGGRDLAEVLETGCWDCHEWVNCPMHESFRANELREVHPALRARVSQFITLFDAKLIPKPTLPEKT